MEEDCVEMTRRHGTWPGVARAMIGCLTESHSAMNTFPSPAQQDDGLDWLREIRRKITAEFDHNHHRLGDKLREMEKLPQYAGRIVRVKKVLDPVSAEYAMMNRGHLE